MFLAFLVCCRLVPELNVNADPVCSTVYVLCASRRKFSVGIELIKMNSITVSNKLLKSITLPFTTQLFLHFKK